MIFQKRNFGFIFLITVMLLQNVRVFADENGGKLIVVATEDTKDVEVTDDNSIPITDEIFYPTDEWQTVKPDQAIPKGLHVRINLQTGLKEAKLMENTERQTDPNYLRRLKEITKEKKKKFRSMDELKKEFEKMNVNVKTDYDILKELVSKLKIGSLTEKEKINIYNDLEYYLHQYDNGQDFVRMKGIDLILPDFNSTNEKLRAMTAFVLGSAMQSNPLVQIAALENGLLPILLRSIVHDSSYSARGYSLYALSCFIRRFPLAQQKFLEHGGLVAMSKLFDGKLNQPKNVKLQIKVITLLTDLMEEQRSALEYDADEDENLRERKRQYDRVQLQLSLVEQGWCFHIPRPLVVHDHDGREKVLEAMTLLVKKCRAEFTKSHSILKTMHLQYRDLSSNEISDNPESTDKYFTHLREMVEDLLRELSEIKDEL